MVKTSPYNTGTTGSIPGQGAKIPHALWQKENKRNKSNIVTNSIKLKKKKKKNIRRELEALYNQK